MDLVEVVRCKNCELRDEVNCPQHYRKAELKDDDYCSYGIEKQNCDS